MTPPSAILTPQCLRLPCVGALGRTPLIALGIQWTPRKDPLLAFLTEEGTTWESEGISPGPSTSLGASTSSWPDPPGVPQLS